MFQKTRLWSGLTAIMAILLVVVFVGGQIANDNAQLINSALNIETTKIIKAEGGSTQDTLYYKTSVGDKTFTAANFENLVAMTLEQNKNEMREGAALLKNDNNALPLSKGKVSVFGNGAVNPFYQGASAGTKVNSDPVKGKTQYLNGKFIGIDLKEALEAEGFTVNSALWEGIKAADVKTTAQTGNNELPIEKYTELTSTLTADYKETAIVVFSRVGKEGGDMWMQEEDSVSHKTVSSLALHQSEKDLLEFIKAQGFGKVIVLLNAPNQMETYEIAPLCDSILYIGTPGHQGFVGVAEILSGKVNPSGHIVDTYAKNSLSAPATVNSGTETPTFSNLDYIHDKINGNGDQRADYISTQVEGIYIGYKYYETRYADSVIGGRGADSTKGSRDNTAWKYGNEVDYTFGHGLSYTTFEQKLGSVTYDAGKDLYTIKVTVKNTGSVAGKSVVQLYAQTPYGAYEINNKVEKSAVQLVGFAKTKLLKGGDSEEVTITVDRYLLASYDYIQAKGWILSEGDYYFAIGNDAHDALNNMLAAQGYTKADGMDVDGNAANCKKFLTIGSTDTDSYRKGENNVIVTNQFDDIDLNYWIKNSAKYITRNDWENSYPTAKTVVAATDEMITKLGNKTYTKPQNATSYKEEAAKFGKDSGLTLGTMKDVPFESGLWYDFIYQINIEDLPAATVESFTCPAVGTLSPSFKVGDGDDSVGGTISIYKESGTIYPKDENDKDTTVKFATIRYCGKPILTGTFNVDLYTGRGHCMGEEALWSRLMINYNIGGNLHRTPFGGRSFEYCSEDSYMTYLVSIPEVLAMEACGTHAGSKHFCNNDQETYREGVAVMTTEQAFRETNLRAFEGAIRVAKEGGLMQSFARVGLTWTSYSYALNTQVLRNEWGWKQGSIDTDAAPMRKIEAEGTGLKFHSAEGFVAGTTQWCLDSVTGHGASALKIAQDTDDGYLIQKMVESAHVWLYQISRSNLVNGFASGDKVVQVTPWWQTTITVCQVAFSVLTVAAAAMLVISVIKKEQH